jgi:hypothetical protein
VVRKTAKPAMAMAAAPYLHPRLTGIDAKQSPAVQEQPPKKLQIKFVVPHRSRDDHE